MLRHAAPFLRTLCQPPVLRAMITPARALSVTSINPLPISKVRMMTLADLKIVLGWAKREGWNPVKYQVEALYAADPRGYLILEVDNKPIASLACVRHSPNFAFLGMYIVDPEYRGMGFGKRLWDVAMASLKGFRYVGLDGVLQQVPNYRKSGFAPAHTNTRWQGISPAKDFLEKIQDEIKMPITKDIPFTRLVDYDARVFSTPRTAFLKEWIKKPESHVLAAIDDGVLKGYGVVSACERGHKIAPLYADDPIIAKKIQAALMQCVGSQASVHWDVPEVNLHSEALAKLFGFTKDFNTLRMYYDGDQPPIDNSCTFALSSLEIG